MRHQTFERFQGMWLGGIVGQAVANQQNNDHPKMTIEFPSPDWLIERRKIAEILFKEEGWELNSSQQLTTQNGQRTADSQKSLSSASNLNSTQVDSNHEAEKIELSNLLSYSHHPLFLLPLMFFAGDDRVLLTEIMKKHNLKFSSLGEKTATEIDNSLLIWNYLLSLILNSECEPWQLDLNLLVEKTVKELDVGEARLIKQLKLVALAIKNGTSLHSLSEKLSSNDNYHTAIALSWYCFITTPQDFKISILRAVNVKEKSARFTAALTGTLSGAYNGVAGIPWNWRARISQSSNYLLENQTVLKLFQAWLGVYSINNNQELYNHRYCAVATPQKIQLRKRLKIISQKK